MSDAALTIPEGVAAWAWEALGAKSERGKWIIPERDADGEVTGHSVRLSDGSKSFRRGGKRGLTLCWPLKAYAGSSSVDPIFIVEGASDTAAGIGLGVDVVGRPSANGGARLLTALLKDRHVCVIADRDKNGAGQQGANSIALKLLASCASVRIILPPAGIKDLRAWVIAGATREDLEAAVKGAKLIATETPAVEGAPVLLRLSDVKPESVAWLWPGRIALGKLTLIAGDPGLGKSFLTLDIAARVSRGGAWPDAPGVPTVAGGVVLLNAEDGVADTILPRLNAAGAILGDGDRPRVIALDAIQTVSADGRESVRAFDLSRDLLALEEAIRQVDDCRLVVIDPVSAYLGRNARESHNNGVMRGLLAPLGAIAERHRVALVAVTHLSKAGGGPAIYRAMGSLAFAAAARAAWTVTKDEADPQRRLFLPIKNNIAPDTGGLAYRIEPSGVHGCPVVAWEPDPVNLSADDALAGSGGERGGGGSAQEEAEEWLRDTLFNGPRWAREVKAEAEADGIKSRTLDRAKKALGVITAREGYASDGRWMWSMPHSAPNQSKDAKPQTVAFNGNLGALSDSMTDERGAA